MDTTTQEQTRQLQSSVRHQRYAILALSAVVAIGRLAAETRPVGDATFDKITCKEWVVIDKDGKPRIIAGMSADGKAMVEWSDKDGKPRITAGTSADGNATVGWSDKDGKPRIIAGTPADGTVTYPTKDGK